MVESWSHETNEGQREKTGGERDTEGVERRDGPRDETDGHGRRQVIPEILAGI